MKRNSGKHPIGRRIDKKECKERNEEREVWEAQAWEQKWQRKVCPGRLESLGAVEDTRTMCEQYCNQGWGSRLMDMMRRIVQRQTDGMADAFPKWIAHQERVCVLYLEAKWSSE